MIGLENWEIKLIHLAYEFAFEEGKAIGQDILSFPIDNKDLKALQRDFSKSHFGGAKTIPQSAKPALKAGVLNGAASQIRLSKLIK